MSTYIGEKKYICDLCNKGFKRADYLNTHKRKHTGEKPYKCAVRNKGFTSFGYLNVHKRIHTGEEPYECDVCKKGFKTSGDLNIHKRTHTGDVCNKGFTCSYRTHVMCAIKDLRVLTNLDKHKRIYNGVKPCMCNNCGKSFTQTTHLKRHNCSRVRYKAFE